MNLEKIFTQRLNWRENNYLGNMPDRVTDDFFQREIAVDDRGQYLPVKKNHDMKSTQPVQPDFTPLYKFYDLILKGEIYI